MFNNLVAQIHDILDESLEICAIGFDFLVLRVGESAFIVLPIFGLQVSVGEKGLQQLSRG